MLNVVITSRNGVTNLPVPVSSEICNETVVFRGISESLPLDIRLFDAGLVSQYFRIRTATEDEVSADII